MMDTPVEKRMSRFYESRTIPCYPAFIADPDPFLLHFSLRRILGFPLLPNESDRHSEKQQADYWYSHEKGLH